MSIFEISGILGFVGYISSYTLLQTGFINSNNVGYSLLNIVAAMLVLISLNGAFNLATALIQISWIVISLFGIGRILISRRGRAMLSNLR